MKNSKKRKSRRDGDASKRDISKKSSRPKSAATSAKAASKQSSKPVPPQKQVEPTIPFDPKDRILLVGEGDLSFASSLSSHHVCTDLTATVFDDETTMLDKYPQAESHVTLIRDQGGTVLFGVDATKLSNYKELKTRRYERVIFNFPHVGGKSKDVNRQVRYNQELLATFFKSAITLLDPEGTIVVTLFEGEPYTLWNIRDLARHSGLEVQRSFGFRADAYPGYSHARTLGNISGGGGWKGEDRSARSYIFQLKRTTPPKPQRDTRAKRSESSDDSED